MMNNTSANQTCKVAPGTIIKGKWHHQQYRILKPLGQGATGIVYLAEGKHGLSALKVSENSMSITSEVNVLKHFSKVQGNSLGPALIDVDDWMNPRTQTQVPFYVMEYIKGKQYLDFIHNNGHEWIGVLTIQLLSNLQELHQAGWVFGDLKPENLIVADRPVQLRFIDVGGTTLKGRSIKEFTDFFDRGYWGLGTRKAEAEYDLFAAAMIVINSVYPKRFKKQGDGGGQLNAVIQSNPYLRQHSAVLNNAILGKYKYASEMKQDFLQSLYPKRSRKPPASVRQPAPNQQQKKTRVQVKKKSKVSGWLETVMIIAALCIIYSFYVYHYLM
ncbi:serine/threonine-protein kinase [Bacillus sp. V2I10]|uniref:serine/threonine-protein kinase n=1 Tax=Bacillus sp. V2I10 TaxID=3042276 RepID=UPI00277F7524|nr:serine/threonine-protein kinase [Bacillus sp. V2I10]MDQ0856795.1 serine/threonine-protein kinase [Bacillus sp. V2I10]